MTSKGKLEKEMKRSMLGLLASIEDSIINGDSSLGFSVVEASASLKSAAEPVDHKTLVLIKPKYDF